MFPWDSPPRSESPEETPNMSRRRLTETVNLHLGTLNIGGTSHIMDEMGEPLEAFLPLLDHFIARSPFALIIIDIPLSHKSARWRHFVRSLSYVRPRVGTPRISGNKGVALFHSATLPFDKAIEILEEDSIGLLLRVHAACTLVIRGAYFPFQAKDTRRVDITLQKIQENHSRAQDPQIVIGDLNQKGKVFTVSQSALFRAGLHRVTTPPTGFKSPTLEPEGYAQAIWISDDHLVDADSVSVLTGFENLSNCHRPLTCTVTIRAAGSAPLIVHPCLAAEARTIPHPAALAHAMNAAPSFIELQRAIQTHTAAPKQHATLEQRLRKEDQRGKLFRQKRHHMASQRSPTVKNLVRKRKKANLHHLAITDPKKVARAYLSKTPEHISAADPNVTFAKALAALSWVRNPIDQKSLSEHIPAAVLSELEALGTALTASFTSDELRNSRKKSIKRSTRYADLPAQVALLMGEPALVTLAEAFTIWARDPTAEVDIQLIGLPTGKAQHTPKSPIMKYLQKALRPIGIFELLRAWFNATVQERLARVTETIAAPNMFAHVKGREAHDMIIQTLLRLHMATRSKIPLWIIKADVVKAFDRMQHEAIETLDSLTGNTGLYSAMAATFAHARIHVRIHKGAPSTISPVSGGTQGDSRIPALWTALTASVAFLIDDDAEKADPSHRFESGSIFADDGIFVSRNWEKGFGRFAMARDALKLQGHDFEIIEIGHNGFGFNPPKAIMVEGKKWLLGPSMRILGTCTGIRDHPDGRCSPRRCKRCNQASPYAYCITCVEAVTHGIWSIELPIIDAAECLNSHVTSATTYGMYTCPHQRAWAIKLQEKIRGPLHGAGHGGYVECAHLPAKSGGVGVVDVARAGAIALLAILDRILSRKSRTQALALTLFASGGDWPTGILQTLAAGPVSEHKKQFLLQVKPHPAIRCVGLSQLPLLDIDFRLEDTTVNGKSMSWIHATGVASNGETRYFHSHLAHTAAKRSQARCKLLASAIDVMSYRCAKTKLVSPLPEDITPMVEAYRASRHRHTYPDRVYLDVLDRTPQGRFSNTIIVIHDGPATTVHTHIPKSYPCSITLNGATFATHSAADSLKPLLVEQQIREAMGRYQLEVLLADLPDVDHGLSAATASIRSGIHYFSDLTHSESNLLLRLRSGALIKTSKLLPCTFPGCSEKADVRHIMSHVSRDDYQEACHQCEICLKNTPGTLVLPSPIPPATWLGFITKNTVRWPNADRNPKEAKRHAQFSLKVAAILARTGIHLYRMCAPLHALAPRPDPEVPEIAISRENHNDDDWSAYDYIATCDAGYIKETFEACIGGQIKKGDKVIYEFWAAFHLFQGAHATLAEYIAALILVAAATRLKLHNSLYLGDNMNCVEQTEGEYHTGDKLCDIVRGLIHHALSLTPRESRRWIPREKNAASDALATRARVFKTTCLKWQEKNTLELTLARLREAADGSNTETKK